MFRKVLCVGMATCDVVIKPVPENIFELDNFEIAPPVISGGGDALNVARVLRRMGMEVTLCTRINNDLFGREIIGELECLGVKTSEIIYENKSGTALTFALIGKDGERHFASARSIFSEIDESDVSDATLKNCDAIYFGSAMQMEKMDSGGIDRLFKRAKLNGKLTFMDAALPKDFNRQWAKILDKAFYETDYLMPSFQEAELITGMSEPGLQARYFEKYGLKALVIKLGSQGCYVTDFSNEKIVPPIKVEVMDTTGAGDGFVGGFISALSRGENIFEASHFANAVAALSVGGLGAQGNIESYSQAQTLVKNNKKERGKEK